MLTLVFISLTLLILNVITWPKVSIDVDYSKCIYLGVQPKSYKPNGGLRRRSNAK